MKHYVYAHINPIDGTTFYVGKGTSRRAQTREGRNKSWSEYTSSLHKMGMTYEIKILHQCDTSHEALFLEEQEITNHIKIGSPLTNTMTYHTKHEQSSDRKITNELSKLIQKTVKDSLSGMVKKIIKEEIAKRTPSIEAKIIKKTYIKKAKVAVKFSNANKKYTTIMAAFQQTPDLILTKNALNMIVGMRKKVFVKELGRLVKEGLLAKTGAGAKGNPYLYSKKSLDIHS